MNQKPSSARQISFAKCRSLATCFGIGVTVALLTGCEKVEPPVASSEVPPGSTWSETKEKFAFSVDAEKAPVGLEAARATAVNASATPAQRAAALRELGRLKDFDSTPVVILALDDESREVRGEAYNAVKQIVGSGVRFRDYDSAERRQPAVASYQRLFELAKQNNIRYFIDLVPLLLDRMDDESETVRRQAGEDVVKLMDSSYDYRADAPREQRLRAIGEFRREWKEWNAPGSQLVEIRRDPEKDKAFKQSMLQKIREKEAKGIPFTTDTKERDAAAER